MLACSVFFPLNKSSCIFAKSWTFFSTVHGTFSQKHCVTCQWFQLGKHEIWLKFLFGSSGTPLNTILVQCFFLATWAIISTDCRVFSRSFVVVILGFFLTSFKTVHCALKVIFVRCPLQSKLFYIGRQIDEHFWKRLGPTNQSSLRRTDLSVNGFVCLYIRHGAAYTSNLIRLIDSSFLRNHGSLTFSSLCCQWSLNVFNTILRRTNVCVLLVKSVFVYNCDYSCHH